MIARALALAGSVLDLGLSVAEDVVSVLTALRCAPGARRVALALNVLRGNPTAYRIDGLRPVGGQGVMSAECTLARQDFDRCMAASSLPWSYVDQRGLPPVE